MKLIILLMSIFMTSCTTLSSFNDMKSKAVYHSRQSTGYKNKYNICEDNHKYTKKLYQDEKYSHDIAKDNIGIMVERNVEVEEKLSRCKIEYLITFDSLNIVKENSIKPNVVDSMQHVMDSLVLNMDSINTKSIHIKRVVENIKKTSKGKLIKKYVSRINELKQFIDSLEIDNKKSWDTNREYYKKVALGPETYTEWLSYSWKFGDSISYNRDNSYKRTKFIKHPIVEIQGYKSNTTNTLNNYFYRSLISSLPMGHISKNYSDRGSECTSVVTISVNTLSSYPNVVYTFKARLMYLGDGIFFPEVYFKSYTGITPNDKFEDTIKTLIEEVTESLDNLVRYHELK